ncbi:DUF6300 family protein [Streptomyces sp. NPDC005386]|uniref:DUF6300 family protein n=1 Tax=Streptomyces sp. NPDC005386 TaxID=3154562 RepID=UPI0033A97E57
MIGSVRAGLLTVINRRAGRGRSSRSTPKGGPCRSFTWRYVVRADGSFCRVGNVDGSLDDTSDEELARFRPEQYVEEQSLRPCSRCGGELVLRWSGPLVTGVRMELCPACDAHRPAARAFIQWHRDPDRDLDVLPSLFEDWETETMRIHGWVRGLQPQAPDSAPAPSSLVPREEG